MTVGAVIVMVRLLAGMYQVDPALLDCVVYRESSYDAASQNGIHIGLAQWSPSTLEWLSGKAASDPAFLHGYMAVDATDPVYATALLAWAIRNDFGGHWSTFRGCEEGQ